MNRYLMLSFATLFVAACSTNPARTVAPIASTSPPHAPLNETTDVGECDDNVLLQFPAGDGKGSSTLRCTKTINSIEGLIGTLNPQTTLLVLDIDDTLLTSQTLFGSDSWYEWETALANGTPGKPQCEFDMIALSYEAGTQEPVEGKAGVAFVNKLTLPKLLLTSRSPNYRGGTERELLYTQYALPANFLPETHGFSWMEPTSRKPVPISYANGILMTTGRDKGKMLLKFFDRLAELEHPQQFTDIILVDDGFKNINAMHNALHALLPDGKTYNYHGYLYKGVDKVHDAKRLQNTKRALRKWERLIRDVYPERSRRWNAASAECA